MNIIHVDAQHAGFRAARDMASRSGCSKQPVGAALFDADFGLLGAGNNDCQLPKRVCPREVEGCESGEGYWMCKYLCQQDHHAEVGAIRHALTCVPEALLKTSTLYVWGHTYACSNCQNYAASYGIQTIAFPY